MRTEGDAGLAAGVKVLVEAVVRVVVVALLVLMV